MSSMTTANVLRPPQKLAHVGDVRHERQPPIVTNGERQKYQEPPVFTDGYAAGALVHSLTASRCRRADFGPFPLSLPEFAGTRRKSPLLVELACSGLLLARCRAVQRQNTPAGRQAPCAICHLLRCEIAGGTKLFSKRTAEHARSGTARGWKGISNHAGSSRWRRARSRRSEAATGPVSLAVHAG